MDEVVTQNMTKYTNYHTKYDELLARTETREKTLAQMQAKVTSLESVALQGEADLLELRLAVDSVQIYPRRKNVEIHQVEEGESEDLLKMVVDLAIRLELPQPGRETIETVYTRRTKQGTKSPIIIRFQDRNIGDLWIKKRGVLGNEIIYIKENLTDHLKCLLWVMRSKGEGILVCVGMQQKTARQADRRGEDIENLRRIICSILFRFGIHL